jgi:protein CpxP
MNRSILRAALAGALAAPLALAAVSYAQAPSQRPQPPAGMAERHGPGPAEREARMTERMTAILQLRPDQQQALQAYVAALRPPGGPQTPMGADGESRREMTTPERLDLMVAHIDRFRTHLTQVAAATRTFYAQLSPSQQQAFDALAPMMMRRMDDGRHGMMDHGMMGAGGPGDWGAPHPRGPGGPP